MDPTETTDAAESPDCDRILNLLGMFHTFEPGKHDQAVSELESLERESTFNTLSSLLRDSDGDVRCDAAEALMRIEPRRGLSVILPLLGDPDSDVRWCICGLLHDRGDERETPQLVEVLLNDPEADVRFFAADALGRLGNLSALASLRHAAQFDAGQEREGRRVSDAAKEAIESILARYPKKDVQ